MVQRQEMTKTAVALQKIDHQPRTSETAWTVAVLIVHACEIFGHPVRLQVKFTDTVEMYEGVLT